MRVFLIFVFFSEALFAQNQLEAVLLDSATKAPIEFADVYNHYNYTTSNADGSFLFTSQSDSVFIKKLGYETIRSTFDELQNKKIITLTEASIALEEVVLTNEKTIFEKINDSLKSNYLFSPYEERFMLRAFLKKNDTVLKLEDLSGKLRRQQLFASEKHSMPKKNYEVELLNMRKAGLKEENIDFRLNDFQEVFNMFIGLFHSKKYVDRTTNNISENMLRINFKTKDSITKIHQYKSEGYYFINREDMAIVEALNVSNMPNAKFEKSGPYRYRTIYYKTNTFFNKYENGKYSIKNAKIELTVEVINTKTNKKDIYNCSYILTTQDNFKELNAKNNTSVTRDIFKLKYPYNPDFWEKQNQLLLTQEMIDFLKTVKAEDNEYRAISNLK